jgi:NTP pyrophosphatase (non-canonical NTP hydrolase)
MTNAEFNKTVKKYSFKEDKLFSMNALVGELGELANVIKKIEFHKHFKTYQERVQKEINEGKRKSFDEQLLDEAGDTLFYFIQLLNSLNLDLEEIMKYQKNKLELQSKGPNHLYIK